MNFKNISSILKKDYIILIPIIALAFYIAFIPHSQYAYLVHFDEWMHLAWSNEILEEASITGLSDPFYGNSPILYQYAEIGFHLFWGIFHKISGISWLTIFRYFPATIFVFTIISVYILCKRIGFGWEAALMTCVIPTTLGLLGPGFLVPISMVMPLVVICIHLAFNFESFWSYFTIFLIVTSLVTFHIITVIILGLILVPYILMNVKSNSRHSLIITLVIIVPPILSLPWIFYDILPILIDLLNPQSLVGSVELPEIIPLYGYLPTICTLIGIFILTLKNGKREYSLILGLLCLVIMLITFYKFHYGSNLLYYRGLMYMMLIMSIIAGAGLMAIRKFQIPLNFINITNTLKKNAGILLCFIMVGITIFITIQARQSYPYYHMVGEEEYQTFIWIRRNLSNKYDKAVLDPWKGSAFTAITGKHVFSYIGGSPTAIDTFVYTFLQEGSQDTNWLKENGISIIYSPWPVQNDDLQEVYKDVYILNYN